MEVSKVYEDENLLVINKPYGLIVHPKNATDTQESVVSWLIGEYSHIANVGEPFIASGVESQRAGVVHRLDKDTSGLLVIAKNDETFYYLKSLFQGRTIKKQYYALVYGRPKEGHGIIDAPLGRVGLKRTVQKDAEKLIDAKPAVTEYSIAQGYAKYALLDVSPKTGRTHQIRVHLQSIGCPIVGDPVYAPKGWQKPTGLNRLFLHAYKLTFTTQDSKSLVLEAALPPDLEAVLEGLDK
jgi:23S rRNA pseudouridine1911/1915/1917 synthase